MNDYENPHVHPQEDAHYEVISNPGYSAQADASAYRADASSEYGYAAASKTKDTKRPWIITLVLILCFKPANVKAVDDKYRAAAGKELDDALVGRK